MKETLFEIVLKNFRNKSVEEVINSLEITYNLISRVHNKNIPEIVEALYHATKALGLANGYTEYVKHDLSSKLGVSKTAIRYIVNELIKEGKIEVLTIGQVSFLKPII